MTIQTEQNLALQKLYILATGSAANNREMALFDGMVASGGGRTSINAVVDSYIAKIAAQKGVVATVQAVFKNGLGIVLNDAQAKQTADTYWAAGINTGSKLLNYLVEQQGGAGTTLDNRALAATGFIDTLNATGKGAGFMGHGVTSAVYNLLQNTGSSATSLANATSGFNALAANLSTTGITGTADDYLAGATVFADNNRDGQLNAGEWTVATAANGTYEIPQDNAAGKIIVYGGNDLLTGNAFKGLLSSPTGTTVLNPFTTIIEAMVTSGQPNTMFDATAAMKTALALPANINLLSYNPLAVLASATATASEKAVALSVQGTAQQISNIITQIASVIDNATPGATLQSAAAAVAVVIAQAITTAAGNNALLNLAGADLGLIIQAAVTATGTPVTAAQVAQIAQITAGSNAAAGTATTITMLAQAADVAQGSATNALIAGALSNNYGPAVAAFTGSALGTANYDVTVGSIAPGVLAPPTVGQIVAANAASAAAAAAAAALAAPTASLVYSTDGGTTTATTAVVKDANTLRIVATFSKAVSDGTPTITINNGVLAATAMTKTDSTHYFFDLNVPAGDIAPATVTIGGARDATSNTISAAPTNAVFAVDNTAPSAPTALTLTAVGGTVAANALNATNTNLTAVATITAGQATGGSAVLKIGATTIATDAAILVGDTSVSFNLGLATNAALQTAVATGGVATVTLLDAAGNSIVSSVANPVLAVDYSVAAPTASLVYSKDGGTTTATTVVARDANTVRIIATFSKAVSDGTPTITINNGVLAATAMTKTDSTHYFFDLNVPAGNIATATVTIGGARDATSDTISAAPTNAVFEVDNTAPSAPTALTLTAEGGTVAANALNATNTNMTAVATITAGQATGGSAVLRIGTTTIATDAAILVGDTSVSFNLGLASNAALQTAVATGGVATVTLLDAAGNSIVSSVANPLLAVDYTVLTNLTTANDTLDGTGGNDTFAGSFGNGAGPYTFNTGDVLNGLAGTGDTLKITTGAEASTPPDGLWLNKTNFEKVFLQSTGNGAQVMTSGAAFEAAFVTNGVGLTVETLLGAIDVTLTTFTGAASITSTTIGAGAHTITTGSGVSTVTATGQAAGAQTINGIGLKTVDATITGAGDQVIGTTNGGNLVTVNATIGAAGNQTITSTSNSNVTIVANAASGDQTINTAGGNDSVTTTGATGKAGTIATGAGNDVIVAGLTTDLITGGTGADTMSGGGGADTFQFDADGSIIGTSMDKITDFNTVGADVLKFGAGTPTLLTADVTALVAGSGVGSNVQTSAGGLITFAAADNTLALKTAAVQADSQLDALGSIAMFRDGANTYVYYAGPAAGNADDQLIELTGIITLTSIIGGATTVIS